MQIKTERLVLREYVAEDWSVLADYQSDPRYQCFEPWNSGLMFDEFVQGLVARFVYWQSQKPRYRFQLAICLPDADEPIGSCGIRVNEPGSRSAELGYELAPAYWGQGYATEAARAMLSWAFSRRQAGGLGLREVHAEVVDGNEASCRVLARLGMTLRGRRARYYWMHPGNRDSWRDALVYGILVPVWERSVSAGRHPGLDACRIALDE